MLPGFEADFTTPEGAILCLEKAYRDRDIEAAVSAKDFKTEAGFLLRNSKFKDFAEDDEMVDSAAKLLELSFREHTLREWPSFEGLESFFPRRTVRGDGIVLVTEVCRFPDGGFSQQEILVAETANGWRVVMLSEGGSTPSATGGA
jgi:hypothetical protein